MGNTIGAVRLWLPESVVRAMDGRPPPILRTGIGHDGPGHRNDVTERGELASQWRAEAGLIAMPQGMRRLRAGAFSRSTDSRLAGPRGVRAGPVDLILDLSARRDDSASVLAPLPDSGGRLVRIEGGPLHEPRPRDPILVQVKESRPMSPPNASSNPPSPRAGGRPARRPVTLTVELGRVNLTLSRLADLKPGDVIELSRHSRAVGRIDPPTADSSPAAS